MVSSRSFWQTHCPRSAISFAETCQAFRTSNRGQEHRTSRTIQPWIEWRTNLHIHKEVESETKDPCCLCSQSTIIEDQFESTLSTVSNTSKNGRHIRIQKPRKVQFVEVRPVVVLDWAIEQ
jgi:hypothetical protein